MSREKKRESEWDRESVNNKLLCIRNMIISLSNVYQHDDTNNIETINTSRYYITFNLLNKNNWKTITIKKRTTTRKTIQYRKRNCMLNVNKSGYYSYQ